MPESTRWVSDPDRRFSWTRVTTALIVAAVLFFLGYRNATYGTESWATIAVIVWWAVVLLIVLGLWSPLTLPTSALVVGALLVALALWMLASASWAASAENAFTEFGRCALYVGVFVFVSAVATQETRGIWSDGIAVGLTAVGVVALASRFFRGLFAGQPLIFFLPGSGSRLSFPVNYWNGLAILLALAFPHLFRAALAHRRVLARGAALVPVPALASAIYLTSSRGGTLAALVGTATFLLLAANPWAAAGAITIGASGSAIAIGLLSGRHALVNDPIYSPRAIPQGHSAAVWLTLICLSTGAAYALATWRLPRIAPRRGVTIAAGAAAVLVVAVGIAVSHPVRHIEAFKEPAFALGTERPVSGHLLSGASTGRWQEWTAAVDEFKSAPFVGRGAGSYEAWWAQHGTLAIFVTEAHSLYLETLAELGLIGLLLVAGIVLGGVVFAARRCLRAWGATRTTLAASIGSFVAFAVGAATDWVWEIPAITVTALACLALTFVGVPQHRQRPRGLIAAAATVTALLFAIAEADLLLAQAYLRHSRSAAAQTNWPRALADARAARTLQPWAASPPLQVALVQEQNGRLEAAAAAARSAIDHDPSDWRNWLIGARLQSKLGHDAEARCDLYAAARRNPRSSIFRRLAPRTASVLASCPDDTRE